MSVPNPEKVMDEEVAMNPAVESVPEKRPFPCMERVLPGVVVPMPILLLLESMDRIGMEDMVGAYEKALIADGRVVVAELVYAICPIL